MVIPKDVHNLMKNKIFQLILLFVWFQTSHQTSENVELKTVYSWKLPDFVYPDQQSRDQAIQNGDFVQENVAIVDADFYITNSNQVRYFVTTPSFKKGSPITLSEVQVDGDTILLKPFPSMEMNDKSSCDGLISVYRLQIDACGTLWVVDSGLAEVSSDNEVTCPPKLLLYDLKNNDAEILRYEFNAESYKCTAHFLNLVVESYEDDCSDSIAYIADASGGLIVYDRKQNTSWRVSHPRFCLYPDNSAMIFDDVAVGGIFGIALSPSTDDTRMLYWHSLGSLVESWVPTSIMKNQEDALSSSVIDVQILTSEAAREGPSSVEIMTEDGILIYAVITKSALACWNIATEFIANNQHTIYQDDKNFQFISGLKLRGKELLIISTRSQSSSIDANEVNFQIMSIGDVDQLLQGTPCKT